MYEIDCDVLDSNDQIQQYQKIMARMMDNNLEISDKNQMLGELSEQLVELNDNQIYHKEKDYEYENKLLE